MVVTEQMQRTMDKEVRQLFGQRMAVGPGLTQSRLSGEYYIPQDLRVELGKRPLAHSKSQHICRVIDTTVLRVQTVHPGVIDDQHAKVTVLTIEGREQPQQCPSKHPGVDWDGLLVVPASDGHSGFGCVV
jgi:hypothetical protein